ncbi:helix-turn-helix domain-containing protein [Actinomycetospora callitridis]|nr:helix-turn-helix domain-containing protein [Actinomycetospora callitridis]MDD7920154.1 helix-turn-helix domain-containing protein [Actinomycetospora callitridis]
MAARAGASAARPERRWSAQDVADYLGIALSTVYQWRCTGYGPRGRRVGRYLRYDPDEVRAWFDGLADPQAG